MFLPLVGGERRIGMLAGYADRSTVQTADAQIFTVAGVVAESASWVREFAPRWGAILKREGIECFHMTDFECRHGEPYQSWSDAKRKAVLSELIGVLKATETIGAAVALDLKAYSKLTDEHRSRLGHPYRFCGALLMTRLSNQLTRMNVADPVAYVFESGDRGASELQRAVGSLPKARRRRLHVQSLAYGDKDKHIQLQAADILAYEVGKQALRDIGAEGRPPRKSLLAVIEVVLSNGYLFDERTLNSWVEAKRDAFGYPE